MGEDVISLDNNYIMKTAQYASFVYPDGETGTLSDLELDVINPMIVCLAISFGNMGLKIQELFGESNDS
jgi:hypothetical protein